MKEYEPTTKQEQAIREYLHEAVIPLVEDVLVKKLGQAMSFCSKELKSAEAEKQKPVAWYGDADGFPVYPAPVHAIDISQERVDETAKHRHEWVGLTDEEIMEVVGQITTYRGEYMVCVGNAIEAKLKEKNT